MKLRNKIAAITAAAMLAFTGVGFAAWTFTKTTDPATQSTVGKVTAAIEANNCSVDHENIYLIADAPSDQAGLIAGNGIYWSSAADNDKVNHEINTLALTGTVNYDANDIEPIASYNGEFVVTFTAVDTTYVDIAAVSTTIPVTGVAVNANATATYSLPALSYAAVPASVAEVNTLQSQLAALNMKFSVTFKVTGITLAA